MSIRVTQPDTVTLQPAPSDGEAHRSRLAAHGQEPRAKSHQPSAWPRPIIFVCLVFHPDSSASSILFTDLFKRLAREGADVTVLCGFPSKDSYEEVRDLPREENYEGIRIVRCGIRMRGKGNIYSRALAYTSFLAHAGWKLLHGGRGAASISPTASHQPPATSHQPIVVGGTDPPFTPVALWALSHLRRFAYQSLLLDVYPDGLVALGSMSTRSLVTRMWTFLNRLSFRRAERLIVIGRDMSVLLRCQYDVAPERITYIPHWSAEEVEAGSPGRSSAFLKKLGIAEKFVVQYSGNMGLWHDIDSLVSAAHLLRDDPRVHFLFIGKGRRRAPAEALAQKLGLTNITWHDFLPRERLRESLSACDAALISLREGLEGVAVPSKLYGILASGRPIVAQVPLESEVAYTISEERCGEVVPPVDSQALAHSIVRLVDDQALAMQMGVRAAAAYREKYTITSAAQAFTTLWRD